MSVIPVGRCFVLVHHLMMTGEDHAMDFATLLKAIPRTALSCLISIRKEGGDLEQKVRHHQASRKQTPASRNHSVCSLVVSVRNKTHAIPAPLATN